LVLTASLWLRLSCNLSSRWVRRDVPEAMNTSDAAAALKREMLERFNGLSEAEYDYAKADFDDLDADGSGTLSFDELSAYLSDDGGISRDEAYTLMRAYDLDGDGEVTLTEFLTVFVGGSSTAAESLLPSRFIDSSLPTRAEWEASLALPMVERVRSERMASERYEGEDGLEEMSGASAKSARITRSRAAEIALRGLICTARAMPIDGAGNDDEEEPRLPLPLRLRSKKGGGEILQAADLMTPGGVDIPEGAATDCVEPVLPVRLRSKKGGGEVHQASELFADDEDLEPICEMTHESGAWSGSEQSSQPSTPSTRT